MNLIKKFFFCKKCNLNYPIIFGIPVLISKEKCKKLKIDYYYDANFEEEIVNSSDISLQDDFKKNENGILNYIKNHLKGTSGILYKNINEPKKYPLLSIPFPSIEKNSEKNFLMLVVVGEDGQ